MLLKSTAAGSPYVTPCVTGDHTNTTDTAIVGLAASDSTHTATADGYIDVYMPLPGIVYEGYATTPANIDTQAELDALVGDRVVMTVSATTSAGDWTIDEDAGEAAASSIMIVGGDPTRGTIKFIIRSCSTILGDSDIT
jgi:hypothetical protein